MNQKLEAILAQPMIIITAIASRGWLNWIPDSVYLKILYRGFVGEKLNLKNPKKYNEKLQWLKLHDRNSEYSHMVDKYEVQKYIADTLGQEYLIPCLGVWDKFDEIDFTQLPDQFVLKCTHDSGSVIICKDKATFDIDAARDRIAKAYKRNYYDAYREWPYKDVKPRIIAEKYMSDSENGDLKDYKVLCFSGRAELIEVHQNRFIEGAHTQDFYDREWNNVHIAQNCMANAATDLDRPDNLEKMLQLSERLAEKIPHVRIDWYVIQGKLYFGEITFFDGSGLEPFSAEVEYMLGKLIELS